MAAPLGPVAEWPAATWRQLMPMQLLELLLHQSRLPQ